MNAQNDPKNPAKNSQSSTQKDYQNPAQKKEIIQPKLTISEKYIRIGKLYEKLEKLDEERAKILAEIKELKSS
ncbi:hypothetical protein [Helicobacter mehlei]|uniref:hypothetical protein n=1 Tax=Helicobacter mehlei TaxID=2316080 RepID=UPI000EB594AE|nr:hypothetical protein [Helicobacter mehlei]